MDPRQIVSACFTQSQRVDMRPADAFDPKEFKFCTAVSDPVHIEQRSMTYDRRYRVASGLFLPALTIAP